MLVNILQKVFWGNSVSDYLITLAIFLGGITVIKLFAHIVLIRLKAWASKTATTVDDFIVTLLQKSIVPILYFGAFYLSVQHLKLLPFIKKIIDGLGVVIITGIAIWAMVALVNYVVLTVWLKGETSEIRARSLKGVVSLIKIVIWSTGIIFLLDNLGYKISAVIAGLGIGGVAVALAAQTVLGDLFSHFAILFDRPFEIGDFIIVGDFMGTVEHIGIKTTRLRSLGGEQLIFSNTDLTNSRVSNYKRMDKRRVLFSVGITYQTTTSQLKEIPGIIKNIITNTKDTVFDRAHFFSYGDFSLIIEVVYYVLDADYNKYMDIQQEINFAIKQEFEKQKIEFAYPTQTLYVNKS